LSNKEKREALDEEGLFDDSFKPLTREDAIKLFGINRLLPIKSSWSVVWFQIKMSLLIILITIICNFIFKGEGVVNSVIAGALFGVFPNIAFIITMQLGRDSYRNSAKKFVYTLICAEFIKIYIFINYHVARDVVKSPSTVVTLFGNVHRFLASTLVARDKI
jgi:F0F1-type ATP synthase assembly protein I